MKNHRFFWLDKGVLFRCISFILVFMMLISGQTFANDDIFVGSHSGTEGTVTEHVYDEEIITATYTNIMTQNTTEMDIEPGTVSEAVYQVGNYYKDNNPTLEHWEQLVALKLAGHKLKTAAWNLDSWDKDDIDTMSPATSYAGRILGLLALDEDPTNYGGRNLTQELLNKQQPSNGSFGGSVNNTIWAMIALDEARVDYDKTKAIEYLKAEQKPDGGFALSGTVGDPDITGEALMALSRCIDKAGVNNIIQEAINYLHTIQLDSAGFSSWGNENSQSSARVISGLLAVGEDLRDSKWKKEDNTIIDALLAYQLSDKSFAFLSGGKSNPMATRQAFRALVDLKAAGYGEYIIKSSSDDKPNEPEEATVRVRVEGTTGSLADHVVSATGTALEALIEAVGSENVVESGGMLATIMGEGSEIVSDTLTSWMYYVIRDGVFDTDTFSQGASDYQVKTGDEIIFYIGAFDYLTWDSRTYIPVVDINPTEPTAGQTLTINISAKKYDMWSSQLVDLTTEEIAEIGDYKVNVGGVEYTSQWGQVTIPNVTSGTLEYTIRNQNDVGYPNVVTYKGNIKVREAVDSQVLVRVEGATSSLVNKRVTVKGTAFDALIEAVGSDNLEAPGGFIDTVMGERGETEVAEGISTSWMYYVIRNGKIEEGAFSQGSNSYNVKNGDEVVFYIGALDSNWNSKTYFPNAIISPASPIVGQSITISISANKYTWSGLQELTTEEIVAIGDYEVNVGGVEYTSQDGQVTIPNLAAGTHEYTIRNLNSAGYPNVITFKGNINVAKDNNGGGVVTPKDEIEVWVEIIGKNNITHYSGKVTLPKDEANVFEALRATGVSYRARDNNAYVYEIVGQREDLEGTAGWKYKVGSIIPGTSAIDYALADGDSLLWFWAEDYTATNPGAPGVLMPSEITVDEEISKAITEAVKRLEEFLKNRDLSKDFTLDSLEEKTIVLGKDIPMTEKEKKALEKILKDNTVSIAQSVEMREECFVTDSQNEVILRIASDALKMDKEITVKEIAEDKNLKLPETHKLLTSIYEFGPKATVFNKPVYISIRTLLPEGVNYEEVVLAWYNEEENQWYALPTVLDASTGIVTGLVQHFTKFAVMVSDESLENIQETKEEKSLIQFNDVSEEEFSWAMKQINYLATEGIIKGVGNNSFEPSREVTRGEFTALLVKAINLDYSIQYQGGFKDVTQQDWYAGQVQAAIDAGIIRGLSEDSFGPYEKITREQAAVMLAKVLDDKESVEKNVFKDADKISDWAEGSVSKVVSGGLFSGFPDETFRPKDYVTRAQSAVIIYKFLVE